MRSSVIQLSSYPVDMANKLTGFRMDEQLVRELKAAAALDGRRFSEVAAEACREWLDRRAREAAQSHRPSLMPPLRPAQAVTPTKAQPKRGVAVDEDGRRYDFEDV